MLTEFDGELGVLAEACDDVGGYLSVLFRILFWLLLFFGGFFG